MDEVEEVLENINDVLAEARDVKFRRINALQDYNELQAELDAMSAEEREDYFLGLCGC